MERTPLWSLPVGRGEDLATALSRWEQEQVLTGENKFDCASCGGLRDATRTQLLTRCPPLCLVHVLTPHLTVSLTAPLKMTMGGASRVCCGVVSHRGTPRHGHYVCHVKTRSGWRLCNDATVRDDEVKHLRSVSAYVLAFVAEP